MSPCALLFVAVVAALATAAAQDLPRLFQLGPAPSDAVEFRMDRSGLLSRRDGAPVRIGELTVGEADDVVLHAAAAAPAAAVVALCDRLRALGVARLHCAARSVTGEQVSCLCLALPPAGVPERALDIELHFRRPGVPGTTIGPFARRFGAGLRASGQTAVARVHLAPDVSHGALLGALAAMVGHFDAIWLGCDGRAQRGRDLLPAVDFVRPRLEIPNEAVPPPKGALAAARVGWQQWPDGVPMVADRAETVAPFSEPGKVGIMRAPKDASESWLLRQQQPAGCFLDERGEPCVGTTALAILRWCSQGRTLRGAEATELQQATCWLLCRQQPDGSFARDTREHAMVTFALSELAMLSHLPPLGGAAAEAAECLGGRQDPGGGWRRVAEAQQPDAVTTAWAGIAMLSAKFNRLPARCDEAALARWLAALAEPDGGYRLYPQAVPGDDAQRDSATAAVLMLRSFLGKAAEEGPDLAAGCRFLAQRAPTADPEAAYFTTLAILQHGGAAWQTWSQAIDTILQNELTGTDAGAFAAAAGFSQLRTTLLRRLTWSARRRG